MAWFPVKGIVKKLRIERRWTREELAKKAGVKPRTVRLWESEDIPRTGHDDTVRGFAHAFGVANEVIANWHDYDPDLEDGAGGDVPAKSTLAARAARDEQGEWVTPFGGDRVELVRPRLFHRISTAPGLCNNRRYALMGKIRDHRDMPSVVAAVLNLQAPVCGQFLFVRRVRIGEPFYASPFSTTGEQTAQLIDAAESKRSLTAIVRIEIREPDKNTGFRGFIVFQKKGEKPKLYKWCFAIETLIDGELPIDLGPSGNA